MEQMTEIRTHGSIASRWCGTPRELGPGFARVELVAVDEMKVDVSGLVHGGFIFGLADYAAMLAVNNPTVVLAAATSTFLKPVKVGDLLIAVARVTAVSGNRQTVAVEVARDGEAIFSGEFACATPKEHILTRRNR